MIVLAGMVLGATIGTMIAKKRSGARLDIIQYATIYAIIYALIGLFLTIFIESYLG